MRTLCLRHPCLPLSAVALLLLVPGPGLAQSGGETTVHSCKTFLAQGFLETRRARFPEALEAFEAAAAGAGCAVEAQLGFAETYNAMNRHKPALEAASRVLATATDPEILSLAHYQIGLARDIRGNRMNQKKQAAEAAFRKALELSEGTHIDSVRALMRIYKETHRDEALAALEEQYPDHRVATRSEQRRKLKGPPPAPEGEEGSEAEGDEGAEEEEGGVAGSEKGAEAAPKEPTWPSLAGKVFSCETFASLEPDEVRAVVGTLPKWPEGRRPEIPDRIASPPPPYTEEALRAGIEGSVSVQTYIDEDGEVRLIRIVKGLPHGLEEETIKTVCGWVFRPAELDGARYSSLLNFTVSFRLPE